MYTEEESFALPSLNAPQCICSYEDRNEQPRLLVVNETGLLKLRAGLGPAGNRYGLGNVPVESLPDGAKVVCCVVIRTRRGDSSGSGGCGGLGVVCIAMLVPPLTAAAAAAAGSPQASGGTKQGDASGGPAMRSASAAGSGLLNVYALGGERSFEVERALQRQPQQQLLLPYAPEGMAHTPVWRSVAALPNFVGGGAGEGGGASSSSSPTTSNRRSRLERGDAVLVWGQGGVVHGYTRWESGGGCRTAADSSTSRGGGGGGGGAAVAYAAMLTLESQESLESLIPELRSIDSPVSCLAFAVDYGDSGMKWRRRVLAGCRQSAHYISLDDIASGRRETAVASVAGPVSAVAFNTRPRFMPHDRHVDDRWGGNVAAFACTELDMLAWLVEGGGVLGEGQRPRWFTGALPLGEVGGDQVTCMECADFFCDGSTAVAIGTSLGKVILYGAEASGSEGRELVGGLEEMGEGESNGGEGLAFGLEVGDDDSSDEDGTRSLDTIQSSRRGSSVSPRPPGTTSAAERQFHTRRVANRPPGAGSGGGGEQQQQQRRPLLTVQWQRHVPHGVLKIACGDFNHDGMKELIVATHYGVHVFRPDYRAGANRFTKTMNALKMLQPKEEEDLKAGVDSTSSTSDDDEGEGFPRGVDS